MIPPEDEPPSEFLGCLLAIILGVTVALAVAATLSYFQESV